MSYKKLFWGILLVIIGILFILKNTGLIYFDWWTILRLWPLVLILWGISLIPVKDFIKLILSLVAIALAFLLISKFDKRDKPFWHWNRDNDRWSYHYDYDDNDEDDSTTYSGFTGDYQELFQDYDSTITTAKLSFDAAAGDYKISDSLLTDKLLLFRKKGNIGNYSMTSDDELNRREIRLKIDDSRVKLKNHGNMVQMYLNPEPEWDFDFDIGAANINFDLSRFKVASIDLDGGASAINLKLGSLTPRTNIDIDAGAASIDIKVPSTAGVEVKTETVFTSRNLPGFKKIANGLFRSDNFETSQSKIFIQVDAGVSSLDVNRY